MAEFDISSQTLLDTAAKAKNDNQVLEDWQLAQKNIPEAILKQKTYGQWFSLPSISELLDKLGILKGVLAAVKEILKVLEACMKVITDIIRFIEMLMGLILELVNVYLMAALIFIRVLKAKLQALLEALFASDLLGGGIYFTTFTVPSKKNSVFGELQFEKTGAILTEAVTQWPGHPEVEKSSCGLIFIPYGPGFMPAFSEVGETARSFQAAWDATANKYKEIKEAKDAADQYIKAKNKLEKFDGTFRELYYYLKYPADRYLDRQKEITDQTIFKDMNFNQLKKRIASLSDEYKSEVNDKGRTLIKAKAAGLVSNYVVQTRQMLTSGKEFKSAFTNAIAAYTDKNSDGKYDDFIEVYLTGQQNNFFMMHQVSIAVINKKTGKIENQEIVFNNPVSNLFMYSDTALEELAKILEIRAIESVYVTKATDQTKFPFSIFENEELDGIAKYLSKEQLFLMFLRRYYFEPENGKSDDKDFVNYLYKEPVTETKKGGETIPELFFKGDKILTYNTRWMVTKRKPITPYKFYIRLSDLKSPGMIDNIKDTATYKTSVNIATVNGDCMILPQEFFDRNVSTASLFSSSIPWDVGTPLCEDSLAVTSVFVGRPLTASPFGGEWTYMASPSASTETLLKYMLPPSLVEAIRKGREVLIEEMNYLEKMIQDMMDLANKTNGLLDQIKSYLALINNRVFQQIIDLISSLLFDDIPAIYVAVWSGGSDRIPGFIVNALQEKSLLVSTKGGIVFFGESAMLASILNIIRAGKDFAEFLERNKKALGGMTEDDITLGNTDASTYKGVVLVDMDKVNAAAKGMPERLPSYDAQGALTSAISNTEGQGNESSPLGYDFSSDKVTDLQTGNTKLTLKYISVEEAIQLLNSFSTGTTAYSSTVTFKVNGATLLS